MSEEIKIIYRFSPDYKESYANGCYGGCTPKGEILINFFTEYFEVPQSETYGLTENGNLANLKVKEPENVPVIRSITQGIILSKENAKEIQAWLGNILDL